MAVIGALSSSNMAAQHSIQTVADNDDTSFFGMILDTINPLQHIPIVSSIYKNLTGDTGNPVSNIAGGTLYGGPLGGALAALTEIGDAIFGTSEKTEPTKIADNTTAKSAKSSKVSELQAKPTDNEIAPAQLAQANQAYAGRMRITTKDWLNASFTPATTA